MYVREAHPGERLPAHRSYEQKREQAEYFRKAERLRWPVLVDDVEGTVHRAYGLLPNSLFLIDVDGRVAFRGDYSHGPTLRRALDQLLARRGRGVLPEGEDKVMHMLGPMAFGWDAIERSGRVAVRDVVTRMPPLAANLWLGEKMRPVLAPIARRSKPLPRPLKLGMGAAIAGAAFLGWRKLRSANQEEASAGRRRRRRR